MRFALMIEPSQGITWRQQLKIAERAEAAGFETLYRSDHYESLPGPAGRPTTDAWAAIAGALNVTGALRHGTLVSPVTFRHPGNIAKVVATVNEMSPGRVELGLGAGWHEVEHQRHGLAFPDLETALGPALHSPPAAPRVYHSQRSQNEPDAQVGPKYRPSR